MFRRHVLMLYLMLIAFGAAFYKVAYHSLAAHFQAVAISGQASSTAPAIHTHFVSTHQNISTHAASLVELANGQLRAFWFAGSREGAQDVEIRSAVFDPEKNQWSAEHSVANRADTQQALWRYVKKLGNPVALRATDGTLWLFYVTVSLGGWAGSSITAITSSDDGASWSPARRLITSPFINVSTLVKGTPFLYADGTIGLPVYHELLGKFSELLRVGRDGKILDKQRLSSGKFSLQPVALIKNPQQALVLMRYSGEKPKRVIATTTDDAGQHWSAPVKIDLVNPNAAIAGVTLSDGRILVALNNAEDGRDTLSLLLSSDGGAHWKSLYQLEDQRDSSTEPMRYAQLASDLAQATEAGITDAAAYAKSAQRIQCRDQRCGFEFSYPYLVQAQNGDFHLVYTWNRSFIKHVQFTPAWLNQQIENATKGNLTDAQPH